MTARLDIYKALREVGLEGKVISYKELSDKLGDHPDPQDVLAGLLDEVNKTCKSSGLPPISALVAKRDGRGQYGLPGVGFWGSSAIPAAPARHIDKVKEYVKYLELIYQTAWPVSLPGLK